MDKSWDWIKTFHAVADCGSLSGAARALGLTQPTVGRHIDLLEAQLNVALFRRGREGMILTERGTELVAAAADMHAVATRFDREAAGLETDLTGTVRIAVNEVLGVYALPRLLVDLTEDHPEIEIELDISNSAANLLQRDADIAVRMFRPQQSDLVSRKVTEIQLGFYAHDRYLANRSEPQTFEDLRDHRVLGFDRDMSMIRAAAMFGTVMERSDFQVRSDTILSQFEGVRAGLGIGVVHCTLADQWQGVRRVLEQTALPPLEVWLACHSDVRFNKRIRLVMEYLATGLRQPYG